MLYTLLVGWKTGKERWESCPSDPCWIPPESFQIHYKINNANNESKKKKNKKWIKRFWEYLTSKYRWPELMRSFAACTSTVVTSSTLLRQITRSKRNRTQAFQQKNHFKPKVFIFFKSNWNLIERGEYIDWFFLTLGKIPLKTCLKSEGQI